MKNNSRTEKYPHGVFVMFFIQLISMIGFSFVMYLLVLYCTHSLHFSDKKAYSINAAYIALMYAVHIAGGYIGEQYFGYRRSVTIGVIISIIGLFLLWTPSSFLLIISLSAFIVGSGLMIPASFVLLGRIYQQNNPHRETGFVLSYVGMNVGSFLACALAGPLQEWLGFNTVFIIGGLSQVGLLIYFLIYQNVFKHIIENTHKAKSKKIGWVFNIVAIVIVAILLNFSEVCNAILVGFGVLTVFFVSFLAQKEKESVRKNLYAFLILTMVALCFWSLYMLSGSALTIFTDRNVDRHFLTWIIPTASFSALNPFFIMILGPFMGALWFFLKQQFNWQPSIAAKFAGGLLFVGLGFLILVLGIHCTGADGLMPMFWIVFSYFLQTLGELLIGPVGFSMVGNLVPARMEASMVGVWELSSGIAGTISGYLADMTNTNSVSNPLLTNPLYAHNFWLFGLSVFAAGLFVIFISRWINHLSEKKAEDFLSYTASIQLDNKGA